MMHQDCGCQLKHKHPKDSIVLLMQETSILFLCLWTTVKGSQQYAFAMNQIPVDNLWRNWYSYNTKEFFVCVQG